MSLNPPKLKIADAPGAEAQLRGLASGDKSLCAFRRFLGFYSKACPPYVISLVLGKGDWSSVRLAWNVTRHESELP